MMMMMMMMMRTGRRAAYRQGWPILVLSLPSLTVARLIDLFRSLSVQFIFSSSYILPPPPPPPPPPIVGVL
uniref:Uncharacterized protein n=1 Tax=Onchocerca volvulus TaxID=6282 RepID=A0A8R1Y5U8_ONCVO